MLERYVEVSNGCHEWQGSRGRGGYGIVRINGRSVFAHRASLAQAIGRPLTAEEYAMHECDNPPCIRTGPGHVVLGNALMNSRDMFDKGRSPVQKIAEGQAEEIVRLWGAGAPVQELALRYDVSARTVYRVLRGLPRYTYPREERKDLPHYSLYYKAHQGAEKVRIDTLTHDLAEAFLGVDIYCEEMVHLPRRRERKRRSRTPDTTVERLNELITDELLAAFREI